jgi:hypothetical protein
MQKNAIDAKRVMAILVEHGYTPNPKPYAFPHPLEENEDKAWIDINVLAVRQGREKDEIPDYPIRIYFNKVERPMYVDVDYVIESVKELTREEAATSRARSRQFYERERFGPWPETK